MTNAECHEDGSCLLTVFKGLEAVLELSTLTSRLPLFKVYKDVTFGPEEDSPD